MKRSLLIAAAFTILGILPSQAVNIADLENARGYAYSCKREDRRPGTPGR